MDLVVLTEPDADGHKNILVLIDFFSRAVELFPLKAGDAESTVSADQSEFDAIELKLS